VALQHQLCTACKWIPELHTAVLGAGQHPAAVNGESDAEDKVFVSLESSDTLSASRSWTRHISRGWVEFPHLDGLVESFGSFRFASFIFYCVSQ